jgi:hypothetical protein
VTKTSPKGSMCCTAVQDVSSPPSVVWSVLMGFNDYPKFISGLSSVKVYRKRRTLKGGQVVFAKYQLSVSPFYKIEYFLEHHHEPMQNCMVWSLDYARQSDVFDSVGYWYVEPRGSGSRVYYLQTSLLPAWIPGPVKKTFAKVALRSATAKLGPACTRFEQQQRAQKRFHPMERLKALRERFEP